MTALMLKRARMLCLDMLVNSRNILLWLGKVAVGALDISFCCVNVLITWLRLHGTASRGAGGFIFFQGSLGPFLLKK